VDLSLLPTPVWHPLDGGPFIGTGNAVVTRAPDSDWVNLGVYRGQVLGPNLVGNMIVRGGQGRMQREAWWREGKPAPVALILGCDPLIFLFGSMRLPDGVCEYDAAGGLRERPTEVVVSDLTGLPIPARAEIVLEGFMAPDDQMDEGPFGEWPGYYATGVNKEPVMRVERVYFRDNPIGLGSPPTKPPSTNAFRWGVVRAAELWKTLEAAGVPDVQGVWCHEAGGAYFFNVISLKQRYPGHARQAGLIATQIASWMGRYVVVVDEDIDPTDLGQVIWAICTRTDPTQSIEIIRRTYTNGLDPMVGDGEALFTSRAIIDACRPFERLKDFAPVIEMDPALLRQVSEKFGYLLQPNQSLVGSR
jgi:4-hydroxy-3-polyprenylbenzoate decarboxylase